MAWENRSPSRGLREVAVCRPQGNLDKSGRSGLDSSGFDCDWLQPYCSTSPCCSRCLARQFLPGSPLDSPEAQEIELGARRCKETPSSSRGSAREKQTREPVTSATKTRTSHKVSQVGPLSLPKVAKVIRVGRVTNLVRKQRSSANPLQAPCCHRSRIQNSLLCIRPDTAPCKGAFAVFIIVAFRACCF